MAYPEIELAIIGGNILAGATLCRSSLSDGIYWCPRTMRIVSLVASIGAMEVVVGDVSKISLILFASPLSLDI